MDINLSTVIFYILLSAGSKAHSRWQQVRDDNSSLSTNLYNAETIHIIQTPKRRLAIKHMFKPT